MAMGSFVPKSLRVKMLVSSSSTVVIRLYDASIDDKTGKFERDAGSTANAASGNTETDEESERKNGKKRGRGSVKRTQSHRCARHRDVPGRPVRSLAPE